jgi:YaiO family outer membrane protein
LALSVVFPAHSILAEEIKKNQNLAEAGYSRETLGNGYADWQTSYARIQHTTEKGADVYAGVRQTERFSLKDDAELLGVSLPFSDALSAVAEGEASGSRNVLPSWTGLFELQGKLPMGWGLAGGARRTEYVSSRLLIGDIRLERYLGNFRGAYTYFQVNSDVGGSVSSHALLADYYYGDKDFIRVGYSFGKEIEGAGPLGLLTSDIEEYVFSGRHYLSEIWSLVYETGSHRQGPHYTRKWAGIGFRRGF